MSLPKGILIAIGGAEAKGTVKEKEKTNALDFFKEWIVNKVVAMAGKKATPLIEVVTSASSIKS